jgi:hypothetical protein
MLRLSALLSALGFVLGFAAFLRGPRTTGR